MLRTCFPLIHSSLQHINSYVAAGKHGIMLSINVVGHKERRASNINEHKNTETDEGPIEETYVSADLDQQLAGEKMIADLQLTALQKPNHDNVLSKADTTNDDAETTYNGNAGTIYNAVLQLRVAMSPSIEPNVATIDRHKDKVFALAVAGNLLYSASGSKDIRVFRAPCFEEVDCFGSGNGMVQSLMAFGNKLYSAHQDNKIRVWRRLNAGMKHRLVAVLPRLNQFVKSMLLGRHYVQVRRHKRKLWIEHADTISALALGSSRSSIGGNNGQAEAPPTVLYSSSWDKTVKVWSLSNFKCMESFYAHKDAINAMIVIDGIVLATASADGSIKLWTRPVHSSSMRKRHSLVNTLNGHKAAVNALAISTNAKILYSGGSDGVIIAWKKVYSKPRARLIAAHSYISRTVSEKVLLQSARSSIASSNSISKNSSDAADQCISSAITTNHGNLCLTQLGSTSSEEMISESFIGALAREYHRFRFAGLAKLSGSGGFGNINFQMRKVIIGHPRAVLSVSCVGEDIVCSSSADKTIRVWKRIRSGPEQHPYNVKPQPLSELGRQGSSASASVRSSPWEYECLAVLAGHGGPVKSIASVLCLKEHLIPAAWHQKYDDKSTGMVIFSASLDSKVKVWVMSQA